MDGGVSSMVAHALCEAFRNADRWSCGSDGGYNQRSSVVLESGACVTAAVLVHESSAHGYGTENLSSQSTSTTLVVANCGDCRATFENAAGVQSDLSRDQKCTDPRERELVSAAALAAGCENEVIDKYGYCLGEMACASTIGDADVKQASALHAALFQTRPECQVRTDEQMPPIKTLLLVLAQQRTSPHHNGTFALLPSTCYAAR